MVTRSLFNIRYLTTRDKGDNHWDKRQIRTAAAIRHFDADVIGLQEAFLSQVEDLKSVLTGYQRVGVGRDDGVGEGETCTILLESSILMWSMFEPGTHSRGKLKGARSTMFSSLVVLRSSLRPSIDFNGMVSTHQIISPSLRPWCFPEINELAEDL